MQREFRRVFNSEYCQRIKFMIECNLTLSNAFLIIRSIKLFSLDEFANVDRQSCNDSNIEKNLY